MPRAARDPRGAAPRPLSRHHGGRPPARHTRLGWQPEVRFLGDLASGNLTLEPVHPADLMRMAELVARYHDLPLGSVDASVIAAAERRGIAEIATLDRRHFSVVRPSHTGSFHLLP